MVNHKYKKEKILRVAVPTNKEERASDVPINESEQVTD